MNWNDFSRKLEDSSRTRANIFIEEVRALRSPYIQRLACGIEEFADATESEKGMAWGEIHLRAEASIDDMIDESEGRKPRPNQGVWDMIDEFRRTHGCQV